MDKVNLKVYKNPVRRQLQHVLHCGKKFKNERKVIKINYNFKSFMRVMKQLIER
jgi:hypothetical protein